VRDVLGWRWCLEGMKRWMKVGASEGRLGKPPRQAQDLSEVCLAPRLMPIVSLIV